MIAKIKSRVDFSGIVNYANDVIKKSARIIGSNGILLVDNATIADSFQMQLHIPDADGKLHRLSKPVKHISVAFSPEDAGRFPDNEEGDRFMTQLAEEWMQEMGIDLANTQYVIARHFDKKHPHCHIVFNRIANDGSVISDSNERRRNETACRKIKQRHDLTFGNNQSRKVNQNRLRRYDANKLFIRKLTLDCLSRSNDWETFAHQLAQNGITLSFCTDNKTGRIRGVAYEHKGFRISGSKLGLHGRFTYGNLCQHLGGVGTNIPITRMPEFAKRHDVTFIPVIQHIKIHGDLIRAALKTHAQRVENREYEVGKHTRSRDNLEDNIEPSSYNFKM